MISTVEPIYGQLPNHWELLSVGDLVKRVQADLQTGPFGTMLHASSYKLLGTPVVAVKHIGENRLLHTGNLPRVDEETRQRLSRYQLQVGDILFGRKGAVERRAIVTIQEEGWLQGSDCIRLRLLSIKNCPIYISYVFGSSVYRSWINRNAQGATMPSLNQEIISRIPLPIPPLPEQKAIARILSSLDDKIELNREMNKTLEAMANAIFKSWFVEFDPVRAKIEGRQPAGMDAATAELFPDAFEESTLGLIPKGWKVQTIGEVLEFAYGKALKEDVRQPGSIPVYGSNGRIGWHNEALVNSPSVVVGRKGNAGTVIWSPTPFFPIDTTFYVVTKGSFQSLYYLLYVLRLQDLPSLGADSAVPGLNRNIVYMNQLLVPEGQCLRFFDSQAHSLYKKMQVNDEETCTLASIRDTLLPKLLSGEIRVKEAEKIVEEVM